MYKTHRAIADSDQVDFVPFIVTVPNRGDVSPAVQVPDNSTPVLRPTHDNGPRSAGSDAGHRIFVAAHDMGDRDAQWYPGVAYQFPESNCMIIPSRCHVFTISKGHAIARNGFNDLNRLGCLCQ